ncbi:alpha/beta-hydrolase [Exidia glandulosa HHB12029]|uniref:Alpha/beta-hydrolase n=1 Tax=Exidia glandulosa HHB12029 TaxID=1314781 RepID=A0A165GIS7_EXIGL|nr:alpha/beta-hydrolase [Exidia glandulosa HHB12029]
MEERGLLDFTLPTNLTGNLNFYGAPANDFNCKSDKNPVVMLHGLSANHEVDLNVLQQDMNALGWCTYGKTYGAHTLVPWVGGVKEMRDSAKEVADFIREVNQKTGKKVDLVGHSEGGVMTIYVPMSQPGIADIVERAVALGPAVHGAQYFGFTSLWYFGGDATRSFVGTVLSTLGCAACDDLATDGKVYDDFQAKLGSISQPGVKTTVLMSRSDTLVAPETSIIDEAGVRNIYVQDYCAEDKVGHAGLAWDRNVWTIIKNELEEKYDAKIEQCDTTSVLEI